MTAAFGSITTAYVTYSDNAPSVAVPSGAAAGDVFIWVVQKGNGQTITPPSGFSALDTAGETSIGSGIYTFAKTADGTESGNFTGLSSAYSSWFCICWVQTGVSSTMVSHNADDTYAGYVSVIPCSTGSLSSSSGDFIAGVFFATDVGTTSTLSFTPPSGFTTENIGGVPILDLGNSRGVALAYKTSPGETAAYTADINSTATTTFSGMGAGFVFAPSGGASTTPVTKDLQTEWNIVQNILANKTVEWNLLNNILKDSSIEWNILNNVNADKTIEWNLIQNVLSDSNIIWNIIQNISSDLDLRWNILNNVQNDVNVIWDILQAVESDIGIDWSVRNNVVADINTKWNVFANITKDIDAIWNVVGTSGVVTASLGIIWNIFAYVYKNIEIDWHIRNNVQVDKTILWKISQYVSKDVTVIWNELNIVTANSTIKWNILNSVENNISLVYNLLESVSADSVIKWNLAAYTEKSLTLKWHVKSLTSFPDIKTGTITFNIEDTKVTFTGGTKNGYIFN